ncbi:MAG: aminodeoxychorismate synthase component I [Nitrospirota bacterium]
MLRKTTMPFSSYENSVLLYNASDKQWLFFHHPLRIYAVYDVESVVSTLREIEHLVNVNHLHAAGFIAYETAPAFDPALVVRSPEDFPLLWFGIYREPERITFPLLSQEHFTPLSWNPSISDEEYKTSFRRIKEYIQAGDTYQVNYSFRLMAPFSDDPWELFVHMIHAQGEGYGAFLNTERWAVCSASPELFFTWMSEQLRSQPMKGTAARGLWHADDLHQATWLVHSEKNRAENSMIVDMVRNDMGQIADTATVEASSLYSLEKYPTLWQMTSTITCKTRGGITDIFQALFPAASITGAPKIRTMQIIAELENTPRKIYTGTIGFLAPERKAQFNVAIRTVLVDRINRRAEYGVGGGIVWDSEMTDELQECRTKTKILFQPIPNFALVETILWTPPQGYFLLDDHLSRLADSADYFCRSLDIEIIREKLNSLARTLHSHPHRIRVVVPKDNPLLLETQRLLPLRQPYHIRLAEKPVNSRDTFLYHKTTYRRIYDEARADCPGFDDVLLWNEKQEITESCIANLVVEIEGRLLTPPVCSGLLPGTYRSFLRKQGSITEEIITIQDLPRCSRLYLANSVRGMWEISLQRERITSAP